jgi:hypothetical protein
VVGTTKSRTRHQNCSRLSRFPPREPQVATLSVADVSLKKQMPSSLSTPFSQQLHNMALTPRHRSDFNPKLRDDETLFAVLCANPTLTFISSQDGKMLHGQDDYNNYKVVLPGNTFKERNEYLASEILEQLSSLFIDEVRRECQPPCHKCSWTWVLIDLGPTFTHFSPPAIAPA